MTPEKLLELAHEARERGPDFEIHMQKAGGGVFTVKLPELLPFGFTKDSMEA